MEIAFDIHNLSCSYKKEQDTGLPSDEGKVLYIADLKIPKGQIIFLLGASGTGKSTLLETLGLMNNTIAGGEILFYPEKKSSLPYSSIWKNENELGRVRRKHFSFIFQNTNLMDNFSAYENVCLSSMIQDEISGKESMAVISKIMEKIGLGPEVVDANTKPANLSGGQRQRLAFARALGTNYTVLFCDEPTGNLDERNSDELFRVIRSAVSEKNLTVITVSHDIDLALKYADQIMVLTKDDSKSYAELKPENIFDSSFWNQNGHVKDLRSQISNLYHTEQDNLGKSSPVSEAEIPVEHIKNYKGLFFSREGRALAGDYNFAKLVGMLTITLLSLGFANGALGYLNDKMNSAFVNWLPVTIPWGQEADVRKLKQILEDEENINRFNYKDNISSYVEYPLRIMDFRDSTFFYVKGRSIDPQDNENPLLKDLLGRKNLLIGDTRFEGNNDLSIIATEQFLRDFHYPLRTRFIFLEKKIQRYGLENALSLKVPIPIRAIVKEIPGKNRLAYTLDFHKARLQNSGNTFDIRGKQNLQYFFEGGRKGAKQMQRDLGEFLSKSYADWDPQVDIEDHSDSFAEGFDLKVSFSPIPDYDKINTIAEDLYKNQKLLGLPDKTIRTYDLLNYEKRDLQVSFDALSIHFDNNLDNVRNFANYLMYEYSTSEKDKIVEVDISKVKEKENFNFLSKVTWLISILVLFFGIISVSLFVFSLLKMHLMNVRMNIGTFKAFGLPNNLAKGIYVLIVLRFLFFGILIAFILALTTGYLINLAITSAMSLEADINYFRLIDWKIFLAIIFIALSGISVSWFVTDKMLNRTPGDLIYGR